MILQHLCERYHSYIQKEGVDVSWESFKNGHNLDINGVHRFIMEVVKDRELLESSSLLLDIAACCNRDLFDPFMA